MAGSLNQYLPPVITPLPHQLGTPVRDFVGRQVEIALLVQALRVAADGTVATVSGIFGMGGGGKTELAYMVAQQLMSVYADAQVEVKLRGSQPQPLSSHQALQQIVTAFDRTAPVSDDPDVTAQLYRTLLSSKRVLILADDALDAAQVRPLIPPVGCALLITSRNRFSLPGMRPDDCIDLRVLTDADAVKLLLALWPDIGTHASELAKLCGHLPLALRISASLLQIDEICNIASYLEQLQGERLRNLRDPEHPNDAEASVEASLQLSYTALAPDVRQMFVRLSVFSASFDVSAAIAVINGSQTSDALLRLLHRRSLLEYDPTTQRYTLHDLVRVFATGQLSDKERAAASLRHAEHYLQVAYRAQDLFLAGNQLAGLVLFDQERAHIDAGWAWAQTHTKERKATKLLLDYPNSIYELVDLRYEPHKRIEQSEIVRRAAQRAGNRASEGSALVGLGTAYAALGETQQAITHYQQGLAIARKLGNRATEGTVLLNLGAAYHTLGEMRQAITHYQQSLAIARELGDRRSEGWALLNLGTAYSTLGDTAQAITHYQQGLAIARELGNRRSEGSALLGLGAVYPTLGDTAQAITHYQQGLAIARELGDRRSEGPALLGLGAVYHTLGDTAQAITYYQQGLAIVRELGDRPTEGYVLLGLGKAYDALGETQQAIIHYQQGLAIVRELGNHATEGYVLLDLGKAYDALGETQQAITHYQQGLAIARELGDRPTEGSALLNLGSDYRILGDAAQAITHYQQGLAIARELGDRPTEGYALLDLGSAYRILGDTAQAITHYQQSLEIASELGDRASEGNALGNLGVAYDALGDTAQAIAHYQQSLAISRAIGDRPTEGGTLGYLGTAYRILGDAAQAITHYQQSLEIASELGDREYEATIRWNLGLIYERQGELAEAVNWMQRCLDYECETSHPNAEIHAAYLEQLRQQLDDKRNTPTNIT